MRARRETPSPPQRTVCVGPRALSIFSIIFYFYRNVVVNFLSQVIFIFLLFLGMLMYANGVSTKEKEKLPEIKN